MFKKPKRNFRSRRKDSVSDEDTTGANNGEEKVDGPMQVDESPLEQEQEIQTSVPKKVKKKKKDESKTSSLHKSGSAPILSFEHEEEGNLIKLP